MHPIKSTKFEAQEINFYAPEKTGNKSIVTFGNAPIKSHVYLYCDEKLVGDTISNSVGEWLIEFELHSQSTYSHHLTYAKIVLSNGIEFNSKIKKIIYSRNYIDVYQIKLFLPHEKTIDYLRSNQQITYSVFFGRQHVTFLVIFFKNDPTIINDVYLTVQTLQNEVINIPCMFSKTKNAWVANYKFPYNSPPAGIKVNYYCDEKFSIPDKKTNQPISILKGSDYKKVLNDIGIDIKPIKNETQENGDSDKELIIIEKKDKNRTKETAIKIEENHITKDQINDIKNDNDYIKLDNKNGEELYCKIPKDKANELLIFNPKNKTLTKISIKNEIIDYIDHTQDVVLNELSDEIKNTMSEMLDDFIDKNMNKKYKNALKSMMGVFDTALDTYNVFSDGIKSITTFNNFIKKLESKESYCMSNGILRKLSGIAYFYLFLNLFKYFIMLIAPYVSFFGSIFIGGLYEYLVDKQEKKFNYIFDYICLIKFLINFFFM